MENLPARERELKDRRAGQAIFKKVFPDPSKSQNFMTPDIIRYGIIEGNIAYELSEGDFMGDDIFGVTIRGYNDESGEVLKPDGSDCFDSLDAAEKRIQELKAGK